MVYCSFYTQQQGRESFPLRTFGPICNYRIEANSNANCRYPTRR